jgi:tripartite-type tricarboxylate transporter receptor subunit TctC
MHTSRSGSLAVALAAIAGVMAAVVPGAAPAEAQSWPSRPVKWILPFGPGSGTDISARLLQERLQSRWSQPVVIENRPGGDGLVAIGAFVTAADDHVLLYASSASFIAHPYQHEKLVYDMARDLEPIARVTDTVLSVAVPSATNVRTLAEFVAAAKASPGKLNAAGAPGLPEFALMAFIKTRGLDVARVPYRDIVQAGTDLGEGRLHLLSSSLAIAAPHVAAGKVRVIAVAGSESSSLAPGVPSTLAAGYPELGVETTVGLYGPRGMPLALRERIGADVVAAASDPAVGKRLEPTGQAMRVGGPEALAKALVAQAERAADIARVLGMEKKAGR